MSKDIKKLKIPNVCFSLVGKDDKKKRRLKYKKQRIKRGFDDSELWSLTDTICNFIIPRLKRFIKVTYAHPGQFNNMEEWIEKLNKILLAFETITKDNGTRDWSEDDSKNINEGMQLFNEHFIGLWY